MKEEDHLTLWAAYVFHHTHTHTQAGTIAARRIVLAYLSSRTRYNSEGLRYYAGTSARDTWNLPMIQIPPVSFPLVADQIARYIDMKSCMILGIAAIDANEVTVRPDIFPKLICVIYFKPLRAALGRFRIRSLYVILVTRVTSLSLFLCREKQSKRLKFVCTYK